jgi:hypothetical protein
MPEAFKVEVTAERGKDKVEIKEGAIMDQINTRASDSDFIDNAVKSLRKTVLRLNAKLKKAQGVLGTSLKGLSDKEIRLAAQYVQNKLNKLGRGFMAKLKKLTLASNKKIDRMAYDWGKEKLIKEQITDPLNKYMNGELNRVLAAVDDKDADKTKVAQALAPSKPKFRGQSLGELTAKNISGRRTRRGLDRNF